MEFFDNTMAENLRIAVMYKKKTFKEYEHTRTIAYVIAATNRDPKKPMPSITDWWPLPTDEKTAEVDWVKRGEQIRESYRKLGYLKPINE